MLSRGKVTPSTVAYYTDRVARGVEDYYAGRGEAEGQWLGAGATAAGVSGTVTGDQLRRLFDARHPDTGAALGETYVVPDGRQRVSGWDLTFSAPKSVSALWAVAGGEVGMEVRDAHAAAVRSAIAYLEEHGAFSRTGKAGVRQVDTHGLVAAAFVHRTSRSGDPQLHTHVLVSNRVQCLDGAWRALDGKALHRQLKPAGMLYHAALRAELAARLGVAWSAPDRHGQAEVLGVPRQLRQLFSSRRATVEADAAERIADREADLGRALTSSERRKVFEDATLRTRDAKTASGTSDEGLHDRWLSEAADAGLAPERWLGHTINRHELTPGGTTVVDIVAEVASEASTWGRTDVVKAAARHAPTGLGDAETVRTWIEATADNALGRPDVIELGAPDLDAPGVLRRRDGRPSFERHDAARYTTTRTLEVEQHVLDMVDGGRAAGVAVADERDVRRAIAEAGLGEDQAAVVRTITTSGDRVSTVVGPAGAGKTRAMAAAAAAWADSGTAVRGFAVSAIAAGALAGETGMPCDTIAKLLTEHDRPDGPGPAWRLRRGEVVIVDEAGMVASRDLARILILIRDAGGKAVLVGDPAQLGAVEAGGLFRILATDADAVELSIVRRFSAAWEADASLRLRHGDPDVIDLYRQHGRIGGGDRRQLEDHAVAVWLHARATGTSVVITAADRATVDRVAGRIQAERVADGEVGPSRLTTEAGQTIGVGDEIVSLRNDRHLMTSRGLWVRNGDRWTVTAVTADGGVAVSHLAGRGRAVLPAPYTAEHIALAYAITTHKAQGLTVDEADTLVDGHTTAEGLYVGMTRGRHRNIALAVTDSYDFDAHHRRPDVGDAAGVLKAALARPSAELSATETLRHQLARSESLAMLAPRLAHVDGILAERPPDRKNDLRALAARRARLEAHHPRLGPLTTRGRDYRQARERLDARQATLEGEQRAYEQWMADHAETFAYRKELATKVAVRRRELGARALAEQPGHLVALLGAVPDDPKRAELWRTHAARIEAYREVWSVPPERLTEAPRDGTQYRAWADAVRLARDLHEITRTRHLDRGIDHGVERSLGHGIELG
jgi:conjugative relaxase-like TrwC/TraI family protein